mgnify:CR=1 FL=1
MAANLQIQVECIYYWDKQVKCNDCTANSSYAVKYPKLKPISVCGKCFNKYYKELCNEI